MVLSGFSNITVHIHHLERPSQPPPFSMTSKLLNPYCFTVSCVPEGLFDYLE